MMLTDVLTSIVGELPSCDSPDEQDVVEREGGSWGDGSVAIERLKSVLGVDNDPPDEECSRGEIMTVAVELH